MIWVFFKKGITKKIGERHESCTTLQLIVPNTVGSFGIGGGFGRIVNHDYRVWDRIAVRCCAPALVEEDRNANGSNEQHGANNQTCNKSVDLACVRGGAGGSSASSRSRVQNSCGKASRSR